MDRVPDNTVELRAWAEGQLPEREIVNPKYAGTIRELDLLNFEKEALLKEVRRLRGVIRAIEARSE